MKGYTFYEIEYISLLWDKMPNLVGVIIYWQAGIKAPSKKWLLKFFKMENKNRIFKGKENYNYIL